MEIETALEVTETTMTLMALAVGMSLVFSAGMALQQERRAVDGGLLPPTNDGPIGRTRWGEPDIRGVYAPVVTNRSDCVPPAAGVASFVTDGVEIAQTPGYVVLRHRAFARVIPLVASRHAASPVARYLGYPRGRWESDTLVIESAGAQRESGARHEINSSETRTVERLTPGKASTLSYEIAVAGATVGAAPVWRTRITLMRVAGDLSTVALGDCVERPAARQ